MIERLPWDVFMSRFDWRQGEHVSLIGPTGGGKTTLALAILPRRNYVTVFGTKPADDTLTALQRQGWKRIHQWKERPGLVPDAQGRLPDQRLILWPKFRKMSDQWSHAMEFYAALDSMFTDQGWTIFADEVGYLCKDLGLERVMKQWWKQGRSIKLTVVSATQRPAWVPLDMYSQATHLFLWNANDRRDLQRLRDIGGNFSGMNLERVVGHLDWNKHEVLYLNTRTSQSVITIPPKV